MHRGLFVLVLSLVLALPSARADRVADLVRIHVEAIGGRERIAALKAVRATGEVVAGGKRMRFTMLAERPDHVRVETESGGRTLVQGSNGHDAPWEFDTGTWPPRYHDMAPGPAKVFADDAEFDDPLVAGASRGFTIEYAGEAETDGKRMLRLLVTRNVSQTYAILLDPDTFFIVRRIEQRKNPLGGMSQIVTLYHDFRPVDGVLLPHEIAMSIDGRVVQQTRIDAIQANPHLPDDAFTRPRAK